MHKSEVTRNIERLKIKFMNSYLKLKRKKKEKKKKKETLK